MRLAAFRVRNFRSINDSGWIDVGDRTALVGRNESGKTNLLMALESLNPAEGSRALSQVKDFPRDRPVSAFTKNLRVVETEWELSESETDRLRELYPPHSIEEVEVSQRYSGGRVVDLRVPRASVPRNRIGKDLEKLERSFNASLRSVGEDTRDDLKQAFEALRVKLKSSQSGDNWAEAAQDALRQFDRSLDAANLQLSESGKKLRSDLGKSVRNVLEDGERRQEAINCIVQKLPPLVYIKDYPKLDGHQDVAEYLKRKSDDDLDESDHEFEKLMKVAGLDAQQLHALLEKDHEARQQMVNRAGAVVTRKIRGLWTDRSLKVRFNLDADHFDTLISDPASVYDVEINLNERSWGFRWFFSFYIGFAADTQGGSKQDAVLLMDEPGIHLHAVAQQDLLDHFDEDFDNQIIYTTHSPFMIPVDDLGSVRTVNISPDEGTKVTNDPTGDRRTLFPLQTALGYNITQSLFVGPATLVVEGVTDYWYLSAVQAHLDDLGEETLPDDMVITPAGSAQKAPYMVSLLSSQDMNVVVLLDGEASARRTAEEDLVKAKLIRERDVLFATDAFENGERKEADVEDLLDAEVYRALVREAYEGDLDMAQLDLNPNIPRIVRRYEHAFEKVRMPFHKTRPARLFLNKMASEPDQMLTLESRRLFSRLFD